MRAALLSAVLILAAAGAAAQQPSRRVALSGSMGSRALLVIDGDAPRAVAVGSTVQGVKLLSVNEAQAVVEIDGRRQTLRLGEAAVNLGGAASAGSGTQITLSSDANGHFQAQGQINGRGVLFLVDTGATMVSMGQDEAERLGLPYKNGERIGLRTANGNTVGYRISLNTVRVGDVEVHNVAAVVQPQPMPFILLGNSFLTRFQMKRENDTLLLQRRY
ncbi:TIGR02281 family clan AA aspartic protease [Methylibium sp. Pch-M]|jgi:aspartyl protease family protein|uniref:retropepsin-like aspartic protease family protein n=1 Tax=Methylibium sp. Pch-M TaxID=2082386 RepID=UPI0010134BCD|nr:retropepsin-like aspartic protease [Methylibium sp. Pch-M]QAZ38804.1 TIGR02281 family clan AA aspartic protease [Methylibium sp. Pch-M]